MPNGKQTVIDNMRRIAEIQNRYVAAEEEIHELFMQDVSFIDKEGNEVHMNKEDCIKEFNRRDEDMIYGETYRSPTHQTVHICEYCYANGISPAEMLYMHEHPESEEAKNTKGRIANLKNSFFKMIKDNDLETAADVMTNVLEQVVDSRDVFFKKDMNFDDIVNNYSTLRIAQRGTMTYGQTFGNSYNLPKMKFVNDYADKRLRRKGCSGIDAGTILLSGEILMSPIKDDPDDQKFIEKNWETLANYKVYLDYVNELHEVSTDQLTKQPMPGDSGLYPVNQIMVIEGTQGWYQWFDRREDENDVAIRTMKDDVLEALANVGTRVPVFESPYKEFNRKVDKDIASLISKFPFEYSESKEDKEDAQLPLSYWNEGKRRPMDINYKGCVEDRVNKNFGAIKQAEVLGTFISDEKKRETYEKLVNVWKGMVDDEIESSEKTRKLMSLSNAVRNKLAMTSEDDPEYESLSTLNERAQEMTMRFGNGSGAHTILDPFRETFRVIWEKGPMDRKALEDKILTNDAGEKVQAFLDILKGNGIEEKDFFDLVEDLNHNKPEKNHAVISLDGIRDEEMALLCGKGEKGYPTKLTTAQASFLDDNFYFMKNNFFPASYENRLKEEGKDIYDCLYVNGLPLRKAYSMPPTSNYKEDATTLKRKFMLDVLNNADVRLDNGHGIEPIEVKVSENLEKTEQAMVASGINIPKEFADLSADEQRDFCNREKEGLKREGKEKDFIKNHLDTYDTYKNISLPIYENTDVMKISCADLSEAFVASVDKVGKMSVDARKKFNKTEIGKSASDSSYAISKMVESDVIGNIDSQMIFDVPYLKELGIVSPTDMILFDGKQRQEYLNSIGKGDKKNSFQSHQNITNAFFDGKTHVDCIRVGFDENGRLKLNTSELQFDMSTTAVKGKEKIAKRLETLYNAPGREERLKKVTGKFAARLELANAVKERMERKPVLDDINKPGLRPDEIISKIIAMEGKDPEIQEMLVGFKALNGTDPNVSVEEANLRDNVYAKVSGDMDKYFKSYKDEKIYDYAKILDGYTKNVDRENLSPDMKQFVEAADLCNEKMKQLLVEPTKEEFAAKNELLSLKPELYDMMEKFEPLEASQKNKTPFKALSDSIKELKDLGPEYPSLSETAIYREQLKEIKKQANEYLGWAGKPGLFSSGKTQERYKYVNDLIKFADKQIEMIDKDVKILNGTEYAKEERTLLTKEERKIGNEKDIKLTKAVEPGKAPSKEKFEKN